MRCRCTCSYSRSSVLSRSSDQELIKRSDNQELDPDMTMLQYCECTTNDCVVCYVSHNQGSNEMHSGSFPYHVRELIGPHRYSWYVLNHMNYWGKYLYEAYVWDMSDTHTRLCLHCPFLWSVHHKFTKEQGVFSHCVCVTFSEAWSQFLGLFCKGQQFWYQSLCAELFVHSQAGIHGCWCTSPGDVLTVYRGQLHSSVLRKLAETNCLNSLSEMSESACTFHLQFFGPQKALVVHWSKRGISIRWAVIWNYWMATSLLHVQIY